MRNFKLYISLLLLMAFGLVGCQDDFGIPPITVPEAKKTANTTIFEVKKKYWQEPNNYIDTIRTKDNGENIIIKGRVISSDASGNIYKNLVIQDESAALAISINANSLYTTYRVGQEIVIDLTNMYIGKYANLQQLGFPDYSEQFGWQTTFMPLAFFQEHIELNGLPDIAKVDTITTTIAQLPTLPEGIQKMQSQLIKLENVHFADGGKLPYADPDKTTSRTLIDEAGNSIIVRNSNYASFKNDILPTGTGTVVAILSRFNNDWQLLLRTTSDCIDFEGNKEGTKDNPFTVAKAIEMQDKGKSGWVSGYIVGAVKPEVSAVKSSADIEWQAPTTLANTIVIGATADTKDIKDAIIVKLDEGTALRTKANLVDNVGVYKKKILITGSLIETLGTAGLSNTGANSEFEIEGQGPAQGDGSEDNPFSVAQVLKGSSGKGQWVKGYIVGWIEGADPAAGATFTVPATVAANILMADDPSVTDIKECTVVQLVFNTDPRPALNLVDHPENLKAEVQVMGDLEVYFKMPGIKNTSKYKLGQVTPPEPPVPPVTDGLRADFETMNGGKTSGFYDKFTSTNGWTTENCSLLGGGAADANPVFTFIGKVTGSEAWALAPNMNGKKAEGLVSIIRSPEITTGCGQLTLEYGYAFTEANGIDFNVVIKQNGVAVKTETIKDAAAVKLTKYTKTIDVNIKGNFTIEFTPNSPSNITDANKDRVCVFNVSWTENK